MSRNDSCPCGSGKRYKHCHGRTDAGSSAASAAPVAQPSLGLNARAAQRAGALGRAEELYLRALAADPRDIDARHMLGVVQFGRLRYAKALQNLLLAAEQTQWADTRIRHDLSLVLGKLMAVAANARHTSLLADYVAHQRHVRETRVDITPEVTVVVSMNDRAADLCGTIASIAAQTYSPLDVVVVAEASIESSVIASATGALVIGHRVVMKARGDMQAGRDDAIATAQGDYVALLEAGDRFTPDHIACMVDAIPRHGGRWGFALVATTRGNDVGAAEGLTPHVQRRELDGRPVGFAMLEFNAAIAAGNLFVQRELFVAAGRSHAATADLARDLALRLSAHAEAVVVDHVGYLHAIPTAEIAPWLRALKSVDSSQLVHDVVSGLDDVEIRNVLAPQHPDNRALLLRLLLNGKQGAAFPPPTLRALAQAEQHTLATRQGLRVAVSVGADARTALIVLGMHRSGTSALTRVLNLCGAFLPEKVKPGKLGVNPKGFWETEMVVDLNVRLLRQLGGDWYHVGITLPSSGDVVDDFIDNVAAVMHDEYEERRLVAIKDPRICVLAPLWHRALLAAGYRPAYIVPMRHPLEVAQSLAARGGISAADGARLWLAYMERVSAFTDGRADVFYMRYIDLLADWRGVIANVADALAVPLVTDTHAGDIDRFLELDLRNQRVDQLTLATLLDAPTATRIEALYAAALARCDADACAIVTSRRLP